MTLSQIRYAVAVSEIKSINATARSLYISQSSLSTSIKELEDELGVELFRRTNRGITITDEGEEFVSYARNVLLQYDLLQSKFLRENREKYHFGVTMHHSTFSVRLFAEIVKEFGMHDYSYSIFETTTKNVIEDIKNGKSEVGMLYVSSFNETMYEKSFSEAGLKFHVLAECPVFAYINKNHPLAGRSEVTLEELEEYPCLLFEQGDSSFYFYEEIISAYEYKNVIRTSDRATTIDLLNSLDAYSIGIGMASNSQMESTTTVVRIKSEEKIKAGYLTRKQEKLSLPGERYVEKMREYHNSDEVVR